MKYSNKKCKCGCDKFPSLSYKGWYYEHAPEEIKTQIGNKRKIQNRNRVNKTNLKRKVYLAQSNIAIPKTALKRQNKPIPKMSKSMAIKLREYAVIKRQFMKDHPRCMANLEKCTKVATEIHHEHGRIGNLLLNVNYFLAICRNCHTEIEAHPNMAKGLGLSGSRLANQLK